MLQFLRKGKNTSDATATADDILNDKTAYVKGEKITGRFIPLDTSDATATANDILYPETAYINGQKIIGRITTQHETVSSGIDCVGVNYNYRVLSICEDAEICITGELNTTNNFQIRSFIDNEVGEILCTISPDSLINRGYRYLKFATIAPLKNIDNTVNMSFDINNNSQSIVSHIIVQYDLNTNQLLTNTLVDYNISSSSQDYRINQPLFFNPVDPFVIAFAQLVAKDEAYGYVFMFRYNPHNASLSEIASHTGYNYGRTNQNCLTIEWSQDGRFFLITSGKFFPTRNILYDTGTDNSRLTRIWGGNNNMPCCMWKNGYWFYGNELKNSSGLTIKTYSNVSVSNGNTCIWTIKNYWIVWNRNENIDVYQIDMNTLDITRVARLSTFTYYNDIEYSGTPYCPITNYGKFLLNSGNVGFYFKELNSYKRISVATMYNTNLFNTDTSDVNESDILRGKKAYNSTGEIIGTMINYGNIDIIPSTGTQNFANGYYSTINVSAVDSSIDTNIQASNIKNGVNILGITGTFTSDANASSTDIATGKTAYVNGIKLTGTGVMTFATEIEMNNTTSNIPEDTLAIVYGTTYKGTFRFDHGAWTQIGSASNEQEVMNNLNALDGSTEQYEGLGGTEEEINEVLDNILDNNL